MNLLSDHNFGTSYRFLKSNTIFRFKYFFNEEREKKGQLDNKQMFISMA